jgi:hypothetical protein
MKRLIALVVALVIGGVVAVGIVGAPVAQAAPPLTIFSSLGSAVAASPEASYAP